MTVRAVFRGLHRLMKAYTLECGPLRARGVPAILLGSAAIVLAAGVTAALCKTSERLPESLREARELAGVLRGPQPPQLNP